MSQVMHDENIKFLALGIGLDSFMQSNTSYNACYAYPLNGPIGMRSVLPITLIPKRHNARMVTQAITDSLDELRTPHLQWLAEERSMGSVVTMLTVLIGDNKGVRPPQMEWSWGVLDLRVWGFRWGRGLRVIQNSCFNLW